MSNEGKSPAGQWQCFKCRIPITAGKVTLAYLGSEFPVQLSRCPQCGQVFVPPDLALGKMLEVEQELEDK